MGLIFLILAAYYIVYVQNKLPATHSINHELPPLTPEEEVAHENWLKSITVNEVVPSVTFSDLDRSVRDLRYYHRNSSNVSKEITNLSDSYAYPKATVDLQSSENKREPIAKVIEWTKQNQTQVKLIVYDSELISEYGMVPLNESFLLRNNYACKNERIQSLNVSICKRKGNFVAMYEGEYFGFMLWGLEERNLIAVLDEVTYKLQRGGYEK